MEYAEHVAAVRREVGGLETAMRAGPVDARLPSCPDWTMLDFAQHVGVFAGWWTAILCEGTGRPKPPEGDVPDGADRVGWCVDRLDGLIDTLESTPAATEIWTWVEEDKTAGFAARRAAHELAVHRFDAQLARGTQSPIEPQLAADGIDEIFVMVANRGARTEGSGETLHLHATDCEAEWMLTFGAQGIDVRHEHAKGDAAIRGAVSDLELLLYQRPVIAPVDQFGDERPLELLYRMFKF